MRYRPHGVVGVIGPWNYPLTNSFGDCIPALMAGNAVVLKPSEVTPLTNLLMGEAALECGAPARRLLGGRPARGARARALVDNVDMIHFTGSTATGRKIAVQAAERLIPVSLELGGKDPMIVLRDADLDRAANMAVQWAFSQQRPDLHLGRARLRRGAGLRRVRAEGRREDPRAAPGRPGRGGHVDVGAMTNPPQVEIVAQPRPGRDRQGRGGTGRRQGAGAARGSSSSRRSSPASTTR